MISTLSRLNLETVVDIVR